MTAPGHGAALVFRVGARTLAVDSAEVEAVARRPVLSRVPHAPAALAGMGAYTGRATPVVELARLLGEGAGGGQQVLLLRNGDPAAVAVDLVEGLREREGVCAEWLDLREAIAPVFERSAARDRGAPAISPQAKPQSGGREAGFLAFQLAGQRFAFPLAEVRAVIREPAEQIAIPGADPVAIGMAPYRGGVRPVIELAALLGLPTPAPGPQVRLLVVEIGGCEVCLRIERALGALRLPEQAVSPAPAVLNRGAGEARVAGVARTPSGLTAILSANRLFDEETMRRLEALAPAAPTPEPEADSAEREEVVLVFRVGEDRYGLPAAAVEAVAAPGALSRAPNAPAFLSGVMSHRGAAIPIIDARLRLGAEPALRGVVVVVRREAMAAALWVDAVEGLVRLPTQALSPAPALAGDAGALLAGVSVAEHGGGPLLVVDPDALLAQARRDLTASPARRRRGRA
jgi:purine-binding chemotaxis protein CheW